MPRAVPHPNLTMFWVSLWFCLRLHPLSPRAHGSISFLLASLLVVLASVVMLWPKVAAWVNRLFVTLNNGFQYSSMLWWHHSFSSRTQEPRLEKLTQIKCYPAQQPLAGSFHLFMSRSTAGNLPDESLSELASLCPLSGDSLRSQQLSWSML